MMGPLGCQAEAQSMLPHIVIVIGIAVWVIGLVVLMVCDRRRERRALYRRRVKRLNP